MHTPPRVCAYSFITYIRALTRVASFKLQTITTSRQPSFIFPFGIPAFLPVVTDEEDGATKMGVDLNHSGGDHGAPRCLRCIGQGRYFGCLRHRRRAAALPRRPP